MEDIKCPICYEADELRYMNCSHYLCVRCYKKMHQKECPLCRIPINQAIFKYKAPLHTPNLKCHRLKEKLELFFRRRNFLAGAGFSKKYRKYLFYMLRFANVYYFRGVYYPIYTHIGGYATFQDIFSPLSKFMEFYKFLLTCEKYHLPMVIRKQLLENVEDTFKYLEY